MTNRLRLAAGPVLDSRARPKLVLIRPAAHHASGFMIRLAQVETLLQRVAHQPLGIWELSVDGQARVPRPTLMRDLGAVLLHLWPSFSTRALKNELRTILDWLDREQPDLAVVVHPPALELVPHLRARGIRTIVDCHNAESDLANQLVNLAPSLPAKLQAIARRSAINRWEQLFFSSADEVWIPSTCDADRLYQRYPRIRPLHVVPNALDLDRYQPVTSTHSHDILFPGHFSYPPNIESAHLLYQVILPRVQKIIPDARLLLVGSDPSGTISQLHNPPNVIVTGAVDDIHPYFAQAGVVVVPLLHGSGTRFKILEALALERPVVSTPLGCEGLDIQDGQHLLVRTIDQFAAAVIWTLTHPAEGQRLAAQGRDVVRARYSWDAVEQIVQQRIERVAEAHASARPGTHDAQVAAAAPARIMD